MKKAVCQLILVTLSLACLISCAKQPYLILSDKTEPPQSSVVTSGGEFSSIGTEIILRPVEPSTGAVSSYPARPVTASQDDPRPPIPSTTPPSVTAEIPATEDGQIRLIELTDRIQRGKKAKVTICGMPNTEYTIKVRYSSGYSKASGLDPKFSDENGVCSWTWRVGAQTKPGSYQITIMDGSNRYEIPFKVIE